MDLVSKGERQYLAYLDILFLFLFFPGVLLAVNAVLLSHFFLSHPYIIKGDVIFRAERGDRAVKKIRKKISEKNLINRLQSKIQSAIIQNRISRRKNAKRSLLHDDFEKAQR